MDAANYTYDLPEERIAKYPVAERDKSKLLVYANGQITDALFCDVGDYLPKNSALVFNNTRVIHARIRMRKATGAAIEVFCLEPVRPAEAQEAFAQTQTGDWKCVVGNSKRWKEGELMLDETSCAGKPTAYASLRATRLSNDGETSVVRFRWDGGLSFAELIEGIGDTPIPPYLNRKSEPIDAERYQTVYSQHDGSVAAPTAGLHFTDKLLERLRAQGHQTHNVTLHVGAGTFKPVQASDVRDHVMHSEQIVVPTETVVRLANEKKTITAVGTTSVRTLETLYWLGVKALEGIPMGRKPFALNQWEPYGLPQNHSRREALTALATFLQTAAEDTLRATTQIMIVPGYKLRMTDYLITNFHQPHSTLLLLIAAVTGARDGETDAQWRKIYSHALANGYRFLSYGDASLLQVVK